MPKECPLTDHLCAGEHFLSSRQFFGANELGSGISVVLLVLHSQLIKLFGLLLAERVLA
jgi:hypothetical protein